MLPAVATQNDVRKLALTLPGARESADHFAFSVENNGKAKGFAWVWLERVDPRKARVPQPKVLAVRVANEIAKAALLSADADKFFTEPHYNGYPAVLVRLAAVTVPELRQVLTEAWRCMAPKALVEAYDGDGPSPRATPRKAGGGSRKASAPPVAAKRRASPARARKAPSKPTTAKR